MVTNNSVLFINSQKLCLWVYRPTRKEQTTKTVTLQTYF